MEVAVRRGQGDGNDQSTGILCDPCKGENDEEPAVSYCIVCNEYLCETDTKAHRKAKTLKGHVLLDRDKMPNQALEDNTCSTHSGKQIEYYCEAHSKWCCTLCAIVEHKECDIAYIDDIANGYELGKEYTSLVEAINDQTKCLKNTQKEAAKKREYVQLNLDSLISEVKKFRVELNALLDFLESSTLKEIQLLSDSDIQFSDSVSTQCDTILGDIQDISSNIENLKKYNQSRQLVIQSKKALTQIAECERKTAELSQQNTIQEYKFSPNDEILQSLKSLDTLGHFPALNDRYPPKEIHQEAKGELDADCGQNDNGLPEAVPDQEKKGAMNAARGFEINNGIVADLDLETKAKKDSGRNVETNGAVDVVRGPEVKDQMGTDKSLEVEDQIGAGKCPNAANVNSNGVEKINISDRFAPLRPDIPRRNPRRIPRADRGSETKEKKHTSKNIRKEHTCQLITEPIYIALKSESKGRDNSPKSKTSSDDSFKGYSDNDDDSVHRWMDVDDLPREDISRLKSERKSRDNSPKSILSSDDKDLWIPMEDLRSYTSISRFNSFTRSSDNDGYLSDIVKECHPDKPINKSLDKKGLFKRNFNFLFGKN